MDVAKFYRILKAEDTVMKNEGVDAEVEIRVQVSVLVSKIVKAVRRYVLNRFTETMRWRPKNNWPE